MSETGTDPSAADAAGNRLALCRLAARFDDVFDLPLRHAGGAHFVGGMVRTGAFGIGEDRNLSVGACAADPARAFAKCIGEGAEHLSLHEWGDEKPVRATLAEGLATLPTFTDGGQAAAAFQEAWTAAVTSSARPNRETVTDWLPGRVAGEGRELLVPADLCLRRPAHRRREGVATPGSSGCAAGIVREQAILSAVLELVERDAIGLWWNGDRLPALPCLDTAGTARLDAFVATLRPDSRRPCHHLDLTTDLDIPVFAAVTSDRAGGTVAVGFGAHPDPVLAAEKATLEACQMELAYDLALRRCAKLGEARIGQADRMHLRRAAGYTLHGSSPFVARMPGRWNRPAGGTVPGGLLDRCLAGLRSAGLPCVVVDLTRPAIGIPVVRVLAPGLAGASSRVAVQQARGGRRCGDGPERPWLDLPRPL